MTSGRYKLVLQKFYKTILWLQGILFDSFYSVLFYTTSLYLKNSGYVPLYQPLELPTGHSQSASVFQILHRPWGRVAGLQSLPQLYWTAPDWFPSSWTKSLPPKEQNVCLHSATLLTFDIVRVLHCLVYYTPCFFEQKKIEQEPHFKAHHW